MKKSILTISILLISILISAQNHNYTFCYGSISVTIFSGGDAVMQRVNSSGQVVSRVTGTFNLYGKGSSTEVLKIDFQGNEYRYDLIRDGNGTPSIIFDNQGRKYELCNTSLSGSRSSSSSPGSSSTKKLYPDQLEFPDMSKSTYENPYVKVESGNGEYKLSEKKDNIYSVTNSKTNKTVFSFGVNIVPSNKGDGLSYDQVVSLIENLKLSDNIEWRLPTFEELKIIYNLRSQIEFAPKNKIYWSGTKSEEKPGLAVKSIDFSDGTVWHGMKYTPRNGVGYNFNQCAYSYVFLVKDINSDYSPKLEETKKIAINDQHQIMIPLNGISIDLTYNVWMGSANDYIQKLNSEKFKTYDDWRLPSIEELRGIFKEKDLLKNVDILDDKSWFWSTTSGPKSSNIKTYLVKHFEEGKETEFQDGYYLTASIIILRDVKNGESPSNLDKYVGSFKSQHPSLNKIELTKNGELLFLKLIRDSTFTNFELTFNKSDTLYFNTPEYNQSIFNNTYRREYRYQVIFSNEINSLILINTSGQKIRANREQ